MKRKYHLLVASLLLANASAQAQNQARLEALHNQFTVEEPQDITTAVEMLEDAAVAPQGVDYTQFEGAILGGLDGNTPFFIESHNLIAADTISTDELRVNGLLRLGLTGAGTRFGMWEVSDPLLTHTEFTDGNSTVRVIDADGPRSDGRISDRYHATHVAGTLVARGANSAALGMSPEATLYAYDTEMQFTDITGIFSNADPNDDIQTSNHSYGRVAGWWTIANNDGTLYPVWAGDIAISTTEDYRFGYYDENSSAIDHIAYLQQTYLPIWSSGNDRLQSNAVVGPNSVFVAYNSAASPAGYYFVIGAYPSADGNPAGYDTITSYGVAKNVLTVAAANDIVGGWTQSSDVAFASFSSAGPTDDGRIKPDVTANGVQVLSADDPITSPSNNSADYFSYNGTSMAAPNVTGSLNLLLQYDRQLNGTSHTTWASSTKALVIHTADEAGASPGPDYRGGWGLMNSARAASLLRANKDARDSPYISEEQVDNGGTYTRTVTALGNVPLKVTVVWTDPQGTVGAAAVDSPALKLINDLDLRVSGPGGTTLPWVLDPTNPANAATRGDNTRDNVEQVVVDAPTAGATYTITVTPSVGETLVDEAGSAAPQKFSILVSGIEADYDGAIPACLTTTGATTYELEWSPLPGMSYDLETSTNLIDWSPLQTGQTFEFSPQFTPLTRDPGEARHFWRYRRNPNPTDR